jgi:midasin (ATPase involved in ribosome maturation)
MRIFGSSVNLGTVAIGAGIVLLAPVVVPVVAGILKPLAKNAIKGSLLMYEKAKLATAETMESLEDLAAEAKAELAESTDAEPVKPKKSAKGAKA